MREGPWVWPGPKREVDGYEIFLEDSVQSVLFRHWAYHRNATLGGAPAVLEAIDRVLQLLEEFTA